VNKFLMMGRGTVRNL